MKNSMNEASKNKNKTKQNRNIVLEKGTNTRKVKIIPVLPYWRKGDDLD